jgi:hypothetical protein
VVAQLVQRFVRCYYEARFGEQERSGELERLLRELRQEMGRGAAAGATGGGGGVSS